jgi:hypothetical protein
MRPLLTISALILSTLALSACGGSKEDNQVTQTRMDDIDSLEGTISDDMINTDESTDEAPLDAAPPAADGKPKPKEKATDEDEDKADEQAASKTDDKAATE